MYENVSEKRKQELNLLKIWAECVGDTYYFSMPQAKFDKNMEGCEDEEFFKAYSRQREIGLKEFEKEISGRIASINSAEEIHYLLDGYNYDNGSWTIMQCLIIHVVIYAQHEWFIGLCVQTIIMTDMQTLNMSQTRTLIAKIPKY